MVAAATSGRAAPATVVARTPGTPPAYRYTKPAASTVMARHAMLNSVRCSGFFVFIRNVHWLHALATATNIVSWGPSRSSDVKSIA